MDAARHGGCGEDRAATDNLASGSARAAGGAGATATMQHDATGVGRGEERRGGGAGGGVGLLLLDLENEVVACTVQRTERSSSSSMEVALPFRYFPYQLDLVARPPAMVPL